MIAASGGKGDFAWTTRHRYFPAVEGMRGVAALTVVVGHSLYFGHPQGGQIANDGFWIATFGVAIFFGISGFLLYRPFVAARAEGGSVWKRTPPYLWRRAVRILPAYWVALTLLAIWPGIPGVFSGHWWVYYGLLQVYRSSWETAGLGTAWTLCIEVTFYLALPLIAALLARRGVLARRDGFPWELGVIGGLALLSLLVYAWAWSRPGQSFLDSTLVGTFDWFAWGMVVAAISVSRPDLGRGVARTFADPRVGWPLGIVVFALAPAEAFSHLNFSGTLTAGLNWACLGAGAGLLLAPAMLGDANRAVRTLLANRVLVYAGTISYGIYLYHYPILRKLLETQFVLASGSPVLVGGLCTLAAAVALGSASWFLVEQPLMRRARSIKALARVGRQGTPGEEVPDPMPTGAVTASDDDK